MDNGAKKEKKAPYSPGDEMAPTMLLAMAGTMRDGSKSASTLEIPDSEIRRATASRQFVLGVDRRAKPQAGWEVIRHDRSAKFTLPHACSI